LRRLQEAGCSDAELEAAIANAPAHETAWLVGADGEARVGEVLRQWAAAKGFALLIDATPVGQTANLDFIAVGRNGVVVVDAKAWSGRLHFRDGVMWNGRYGKSREVEGVQRQVEQVAAVLHGAGLTLPVRGMLCMANENEGLPSRGLEHLGAVAVGTPDEVGRAIGGRGRLAEVDVDRAVAALCEAFTMYGFIPRMLSAPRPRLAAPQLRVARRRLAVLLRHSAPLLRWCLRPRAVLAFACLAAALHVAGIIRSATTAPTYFSSSSPGPSLRTALPDLRTIAFHAADGPVRGPSVNSTTNHIRLTFRRGDCRVIFHIDRTAADYVAGAKLTKGRVCGT
jgi:hypothetical protein